MRGNKGLLALVLVISLLLTYFIFNRSKSTIKPELRNFALDDTASVDKIFIADKLKHKAELTRKSSGEWLVNGKYPARQDAVNNLLATLKKLSVKAPVAKSMQDNVLKDLAGPLQRKIEIYSKGSRIKTIYVGGETLDKLGTFMMLENSAVPFEVYVPGHHGFLQTRFITDASLWRDQAIFSHPENQIKSLRVHYPGQPQNGFTITRAANGKIQLSGLNSNMVPDTLKIHRYLAEYRRVVYEYVISESFPRSKKDSIVRSVPFAEITLTDNNGNVSGVKCFYRSLEDTGNENQVEKSSSYDPERLYVLSAENEFFLAQYFQFQRILVSVKDLIK